MLFSACKRKTVSAFCIIHVSHFTDCFIIWNKKCISWQTLCIVYLTMILLICIFPLRHGYSLYPVCKQFRSRSDYTYTQADLDLHWSSTWWKGYSLYPMCKQCRSDKTTQMCRLIVIYVSCALDNRCTMRERIFSLVRVINR